MVHDRPLEYRTGLVYDRVRGHFTMFSLREQDTAAIAAIAAEALAS
jgi:hypothetical protein